MIPSNADPRRADRIVRQKPQVNANGQAEDLTPDYMNILGQRATTANASAEASSEKHVDGGGNVGAIGLNATGSTPTSTTTIEDPNIQQQQQQQLQQIEDTNTNVIPTSPQYGVAIIPNSTTLSTASTDLTSDHSIQITTDNSNDTNAKQIIDDGSKDLHSTPSRNDRFKVVKIASLEPFKRGRWKCMDYVDEVPPTQLNQLTQQQQQQQQQNKITQSSSSIPVGGGGVYLQTQSLPQQQIQQMLLQSGYTNGTQYFQNVPAQLMPQTQYFYPPAPPPGTNIQTQTLPQQLINATTATSVPSSMPAQFINPSQPYFTNVVPNSAAYAPMPTNYQNVQYVPANLIQNQNSAFVPTSQTVQLPANFQQSQTYGGQPMVNGHAYTTQPNDQQQQQQQQAATPQQPQQNTAASLPTQTVKSVILNNVQQQQQPIVPQQIPPQNSLPVLQNSTQSIPLIQQSNQPYPQQQNFQQAPPQVQPTPQQFQQQQQPPQQQQQQPQSIPQSSNTQSQQQPQSQPPQQQQQQQQQQQNFDQSQANNVYTNPQFDMNVNSLTILENSENQGENISDSNSVEVTTENPDDPSKTNPVVNAIDNKIEQAMDLVKSHLMYTVREEVEVLKEKIAELMEKIQQLESENNFLRSQIPKNQVLPQQMSGSGGGGGGTTTTSSIGAAVASAIVPPTTATTSIIQPQSGTTTTTGGVPTTNSNTNPPSSAGGGGGGGSVAVEGPQQ